MKKIVFAIAIIILTPTLAVLAGVATVDGVDTVTNTLTINTGGESHFKVDNEGPHNKKTYKVDNFTSIMVNGLKGTLAEITPGMKVNVTIGMDRDIAASISAFGAPPAPLATATPAKLLTGVSAPLALGRAITEEKIVSLTSDSITVGEDGANRLNAYKITKYTEITVDSKKVEFTALRVGMKVLVKVGSERDTLDAIDARD